MAQVNQHGNGLWSIMTSGEVQGVFFIVAGVFIVYPMYRIISGVPTWLIIAPMYFNSLAMAIFSVTVVPQVTLTDQALRNLINLQSYSIRCINNPELWVYMDSDWNSILNTVQNLQDDNLHDSAISCINRLELLISNNWISLHSNTCPSNDLLASLYRSTSDVLTILVNQPQHLERIQTIIDTLG